MGYTVTSSRDVLGNRSLCFFFICAFGLVTLLQQIIYGKNYIKSGLQFSWQSGDETENWTGTFNFTDDGALKPASDRDSRYFEFYDGPYEYNSTTCKELRQEIMDVKVLSMVKNSELFDKWKSLQACKWQMNKAEANAFKASLSRCCNAPAFMFTTQRNTPFGTKLRYEVDTSGVLHISPGIFKMFPKDMPYSRSQFKKCAVIGNGGILKNSKCGKAIDSADFVFRCNLPPISEEYAADVGYKTNIVTINPSIITERFQKLEKWRKPFYEVLQTYENSSVVLPAFYNTHNTDVSFRVKYVLDDFDSPQSVFYFHPQYLLNVQRFWMMQGVVAKRLSTGLMLVTAAMELCEEVHLYGFWGFPMDPNGIFMTHHYYDNVKPRPGFHAMPHEIFNFLHLHSRGILQVHTRACSR
ncbi:alpha-2,8-sialyltransferase 8E-like isoform X1 [Polyodon spathula]|uniref:alpha-2,8-sialyltransferase 8E-like isoform X1 n=1 Tax=Polyodon spathula TaxID=7913 RepID=UPI001B7DA781|nr:alpha-2,8-sialyltransferase 8E-like isoform X1 [Polyodon spathula]